MTFPTGDCTTSLTKAVRTTLAEKLGSAVSGEVFAISVVCSADASATARPAAVASLKVPDTNVRTSKEIAFQLQTIVGRDIQVFGALRPLAASSGGAAVITVKAVALPVTAGEVALDCAAGTPNTASSLTLTTSTGGAQCVPVLCGTGYYKALTADNTNVVCTDASTAGADIKNKCVVNSDCTWESGKGDCTNQVCGASPSLSKVSVRAAGAVNKHWCLSTQDCRVHGDTAAQCQMDAGLGNWCTCGSGFSFPSKLVPLCLPSAATTVRLSFSVQFSGLTCPLNDGEEAAARLLSERVLGQIVTFNAFCEVQGTVTFMGVANVATALAQEIAASSDVRVIVNKMRTELGTPLLGRAPSVLQGTYTGLHGAVPVLSTAGAPLQCYSERALSARFDLSGKCQALECPTFYVLTTINGLTTCALPITRAPVLLPKSEDDDTTDTILIVIAAVSCGVLLLAVIAAILLCTRKKKDHVVDQGATSKEQPQPAGRDEFTDPRGPITSPLPDQHPRRIEEREAEMAYTEVSVCDLTV